MSEPALSARFDIDMVPGEAALAGTGRLDFTKTWTGEMAGASQGVMLSGGDPGTGEAGYVALEVFEGSIGDRTGTIALQQYGTMHDGLTVLTYALVPGSGTGQLAGLTGSVELDTSDGHVVTLRLA